MNLARMLRNCPTAMTVYAYLAERIIRSGRNKLFTNRDKIGRDLGIKSHKTITKALKILTEERAIYYKARSRSNTDGKQCGKFYEISLGKGYSSTLCKLVSSLGKEYSNGPSVKMAVEGKGYLNGPSSLKREGAGAVSASATTPPPKTATTTAPDPRVRKYTKAEITGKITP